MIWVGYRCNPATARELLEDPGRLGELLESDDDETSVDLDKAWHGIHWLLTGAEGPTADVPSEAIFGGDPFGEDLGYGPGRLLPAERVIAVAAALRDLDSDTLRTRMDPAAMTTAGIYPGIWDEEDVFEDELAPAYEDLRRFLHPKTRCLPEQLVRGESVIQTIS